MTESTDGAVAPVEPVEPVEPAAVEPVAPVEPAPVEPAATEPTPPEEGKGTLLTGDEEKTPEPEGAPDEYADFEMPEGMTLDEGLRDQALPLMKELDLSQDQAQKAATWLANLRKTEATTQDKTLAEENEAWIKSSKNHEVYGGAQFEENMGRINQALGQVATDGYKKLMTASGYGNHPDVIHTWHNIAAKIVIKEDQPGSDGAPTQGERDPATAWYPETKTDSG